MDGKKYILKALYASKYCFRRKKIMSRKYFSAAPRWEKQYLDSGKIHSHQITSEWEIVWHWLHPCRDIFTSPNILLSLFASIWKHETIPDDWSKGLIVKPPKKENYTYVTAEGELHCSQSQVRYSVQYFFRIDKVVDNRLREEQVGFRRGRGWIDNNLQFLYSAYLI